MTMTNEEYVATGGAKCPFCGKESVAGGFVEIDYGTACQASTCDACNAEWVDIYKLEGYEPT